MNGALPDQEHETERYQHEKADDRGPGGRDLDREGNELPRVPPVGMA